MNSTLAGVLTLVFILLVLAAVYIPLGDYMARVYSSTKDLAVERLLYRVGGVDPRSGQTWRGYALSVVGFSAASLLVLYALQRLQGVLPWSDGKPGMSPTVAFNTAISFVANTNWQSYTPESTISNLTQMLGLAVQNFLSAAVGMAVAVALIRGIVARKTGHLGNFWVDLVRGTIRILLPLAAIVAVIFVLQGAVQSWRTGFDFTMLDGTNGHAPVGPFASQEAIKLVGTNGGGTYGANSAHPFSNPTPLTNVVQILAILIIPVCLTRTYGTLVGDRKQGLTLLGVMATIWGAMLAIVWTFEARTDGLATRAAGAALEGKELRFDIPGSALFAVSTTGTSTGAVNAAHDSFSAAGGGALIWNMLLGEVAPGGVGSGLYGLLVLAIITVFVGGLLVGRSPEFRGKRIGQHEITLAALYVLVMPALVLLGVSITVLLSSTTGFLSNDGPHGFSEILYAYASAANNNGSAFGGITVTSDWFQISLGLAMLFGRLLPIVVVLALAGRLAGQSPKETDPATALPSRGILYGALLLGTTLLVAGLTFFPAMALGPIAEALS
ncbi:potassium-transporting ATPase subunit KdpA [Gordonia sp. PDNC005]|uniref:potassium-transporting ATPase subunit KdpA n=1 Tax=unclassified Gordonia (in: high G+C Gram-positive bacteria) TaxID=2657482 RepID=UPI001965CB10|nr:potassium-transporting ATPase subunit KdpA [Gordonia sp. PDNC005]QRY61961.1 potassium-transporting ATPase subunit KdpA [Gordonia sp. PDNC005]